MARPRPTVAEIHRLESANNGLRKELADRTAQLEARNEDIDGMRSDLRTANRRRAELEDQLKAARTGEGGALEACVQALDGLRSAAVRDSFGAMTVHYDWGSDVDARPQPTPEVAHEVYADPVGRVLLHLAARFRVPIVPDPRLSPDTLGRPHG